MGRPVPDARRRRPVLLRDRASGTPIHVALVNAAGQQVAPQDSVPERNPRYRHRAGRPNPPAEGDPEAVSNG